MNRAIYPKTLPAVSVSSFSFCAAQPDRLQC
jgi:hypothetical protein